MSETESQFTVLHQSADPAAVAAIEQRQRPGAWRTGPASILPPEIPPGLGQRGGSKPAEGALTLIDDVIAISVLQACEFLSAPLFDLAQPGVKVGFPRRASDLLLFHLGLGFLCLGKKGADKEGRRQPVHRVHAHILRCALEPATKFAQESVKSVKSVSR